MNIEEVIAKDPYLRTVLPMPDTFYEKYKLEKPKPLEFKDSLNHITFTYDGGTVYSDGNLDKTPSPETSKKLKF